MAFGRWNNDAPVAPDAGGLIPVADGGGLKDPSGNKSVVVNDGGSTDIYHNNSKKFASAPTGLALEDGESVSYDPIPGTDETATGQITTVTVDANATGFGAILCLSADGNYDEADADAEATAGFLVMALESGTGSKLVLLDGFVRDDTWDWTPGAALYLSTTTGAMTETQPSGSGDIVRKLGYALSADVVRFCPSIDNIEIT